MAVVTKKLDLSIYSMLFCIAVRKLFMFRKPNVLDLLLLHPQPLIWNCDLLEINWKWILRWCDLFGVVNTSSKNNFASTLHENHFTFFNKFSFFFLSFNFRANGERGEGNGCQIVDFQSKIQLTELWNIMYHRRLRFVGKLVLQKYYSLIV